MAENLTLKIYLSSVFRGKQKIFKPSFIFLGGGSSLYGLGFFSCCLVYRLYYIELGALRRFLGNFAFLKKFEFFVCKGGAAVPNSNPLSL
ncbi:MAG: hypothetical protein IKS15_01730, partial [Opitutales bacterium]|nr:hypothetical protein [Opitutales bacterium]